MVSQTNVSKKTTKLLLKKFLKDVQEFVKPYIIAKDFDSLSFVLTVILHLSPVAIPIVLYRLK